MFHSPDISYCRVKSEQWRLYSVLTDSETLQLKQKTHCEVWCLIIHSPFFETSDTLWVFVSSFHKQKIRRNISHYTYILSVVLLFQFYNLFHWAMLKYQDFTKSHKCCIIRQLNITIIFQTLQSSIIEFRSIIEGFALYWFCSNKNKYFTIATIKF